MNRVRKPYMWLLGQDDNLGDIVLRRRLLQHVVGDGRPAVYFGSSSQDYIRATTHGHDVEIFDSSSKWYFSLLLSAVRGRAHLYFPPGEVREIKSVGVWNLLMLPVLILVRATGGKVHNLGSGLYSEETIWIVPIRMLSRLAEKVVVRDSQTQRRLGHGNVMPDLAFDEYGIESGRGPEQAPRDVLALSFRGKNFHLNESARIALKEVALQLRLQLIVVVQVRSDHAAMEQFASEIGANFLGWSSDTSAVEQEKKVRQVYSEAVIVMSDRIHSLIIGATEGALPIGFMQHADDKVGRHLEAAGLEDMSLDATSLSTDQIRGFVNCVLERSESSSIAIAQAARAVTEYAPIPSQLEDC